jgi:hypothetical protein
VIKLFQINYEGFGDARKAAKERFTTKFDKYFGPSIFLKFQRDARGRIQLEALFNYISTKVKRNEFVTMLLKYDTSGEGYLKEQVKPKAFPSAHLQDINKLIEDQLGAIIVNAKLDAYYKGFFVIYCARKFCFFADPLHKGKVMIKDLVNANS